MKRTRKTSLRIRSRNRNSIYHHLRQNDTNFCEQTVLLYGALAVPSLGPGTKIHTHIKEHNIILGFCVFGLRGKWSLLSTREDNIFGSNRDQAFKEIRPA
jgi:hypothetical protein